MADSATTSSLSSASSAAAAAAAAASNYKKLKEDFVSNLSGGSAGEVFLVTAVAPVAVLAWSVLQRRRSFFRPYSPLAFVVDFCLNAGAILLAITLYASQPALLNGLLLAPTLLVLALPRGGARPPRRAAKPDRPAKKTDPLPGPAGPAGTAGAAGRPAGKKAFLTTYRGAMMVITCLAILAVDFRIFPRRFAKVETWGTSLMDMGVGSFVFSAGVVSARAVLKERASAAPSLVRRLGAALRHALPLLALGVVRLLSVKGLDYAEHVTEYGVHWNFFFTLGLLPPFVAAAQAALQVVPVPPAALTLLLAGAYEAALAAPATGLKAYVLTAPRTDLLSKNREGLASFVGYLAIFLAGQDTGLRVLEDAPAPAPVPALAPLTSALARLRRAAAAHPLPVWAAVWWALHQAAIGVAPYGLGLTESRRLANLPYVLWVLAFNTQQLALFYLVDKLVFGGRSSGAAAASAAAPTAHDEATSTVLRAYNRNGLPVFLAANLLTGLVNLTVPTLHVSPATALGILVAYAGALTALAVGLDAADVTLRL